MARIVSKWVAINWNTGKRPVAVARAEPVEGQRRIAEVPEGDLGAAAVGALP